MRNVQFNRWLLQALLLTAIAARTVCAQDHAALDTSVELRLRIALPQTRSAHAVPAVIWLDPQPGTPAPSNAPTGQTPAQQPPANAQPAPAQPKKP